jgi:acyl-CoA synthetase (AMP-forming)/AMP-acid ligase II
MPDFLDTAHTLTEAFEALVARDPDSERLIFLDRHDQETRVRVGDVWARARSVQATLVAQGIEPGRIVVLILPTGVELIAVYLGVLLAGGVPALLSTPSNRIADPLIFLARVAHVVSTGEPHAIVCEPNVAGLLAQQPEHFGSVHVLTPEAIEAVERAPEAFRGDGNAIATVQFSSGTTGKPKGVLVSHAAVLDNLRAMRSAFGLTSSDVAINWIPLFHDMGLFGAFLLPLLCDCRTVLIPTDDFMRDPAVWLRAFDRYRGTFGWGPNLSYSLCGKRLADEALEGLDLSSWRLALNGSEPVIAKSIDAFVTRLAPFGLSPNAMSPAWGLAETTVLGTVQPPSEPPRCEILDRAILAGEDRAELADEGVSVVSVGTCIPGTELEIRDASGRRLPDRQVGVVWLRSGSLFTGYHEDPALTEQALVDGWLDTGDRGYLSDGHLFFVVRKKDLIIIGGEKYIPDDLEAIINRVPGVREGCAVAFGLLNEQHGTEQLGAVVETRVDDAEGRDELKRAIRKKIARTTGLTLSQLVLTEPGGVEKTTSGKLARSATRERHRDALGL